jgi:NAD(P) transhydrogenase subunit alpha
VENNSVTINIVAVKETVTDEKRVALDPQTANRLAKKEGLKIIIESGAGDKSSFSDADYKEVEVKENASSAIGEADILLKVQPVTVDEINTLKEGAIVIGFMFAHQNREMLEALKSKKITSFAMELIPRITRAQSMDALSSQATVAGYKAAIIAAEKAVRFFPMLTTAAGTIRPSKVIVIGAGVAGLQAIATARRLGAQVEAYDIRPAAREQVESLGAKMIDTGVNAEGEGGYARELTDEEKQKQADALAAKMTTADAVISTAAIPGRPAPKIINRAMVDGMKNGAVIIDLAAETGGNCELTEPGKTINYNGKIIDGPLNLASQTPVHASEMYAKNCYNLLELLVKDGQINLDFEDDVITGALLTHDGELKHPGVKQLLGEK